MVNEHIKWPVRNRAETFSRSKHTEEVQLFCLFNVFHHKLDSASSSCGL